MDQADETCTCTCHTNPSLNHAIPCCIICRLCLAAVKYSAAEGHRQHHITERTRQMTRESDGSVRLEDVEVF